jgi:hypothetical protein
MAAGGILLCAPPRLFEVSSTFRRLLFETRVEQLFDRRFAIERQVYRGHRIVGTAVIVGAVAVIALLWYFGQKPYAVRALRGLLGTPGAHVLTLVAATLAVVLAVVGTCLAIRPSILKGIEAASNRWIEPMPTTNPHMALSRWVLRAPRVVGLVLLVAGVLCLRPF